jgi:hypothetical protein
MEDKKIFELDLQIITTENEILRINCVDGQWKGTPGTNGKETAKLAIKFLQNYL